MHCILRESDEECVFRKGTKREGSLVVSLEIDLVCASNFVFFLKKN